MKKKFVSKISGEERKVEFERFLKECHVSSATRNSYIKALEKGYSEAPLPRYKSIYDITDPEILENKDRTRGIRQSSVFARASKGGTNGLAGLNWYIKYLKDSRDSYYDFLNHFGIKYQDLFDWGMEAIIFPPLDMVEEGWESLKHRILNDEEVFIRGAGRDARGTQLYLDFYEYMLGNSHVKKDDTNNKSPKLNIERMTGLRRNKDIYNYQISHIWGQTKNVFLFEAPWNVCYTPKIIDPFTGHETKGDLPEVFKRAFLGYAQKKYKRFIIDYNNIIQSYNIDDILEKYCTVYGINDKSFIKNAKRELAPIEII